MISCDEASIICNKSQYEEASFWEKVKFKWHLRFCKACSKFTKKNTQLTTLCQEANLHSLSERDKEAMKAELQKNS